MKRVCVLILLLASGLLLPLAASHAANLQAGWYVNITSVQIGLTMGEQVIPIWGQFDVEGQYGPFLVTDGPTHSYTRRYISVPTNAYGVGPDQSLTLPILAVSQPPGTYIHYVSVGYETNYDPSQMRLELWHERLDGSEELLWAQLQGGNRWGGGGVGPSACEGPYYLKVSVLPEPTAIASLLFGVGGLAVIMRRRRRADRG